MLGEGIEQLCVFVVFCALGVGFSALYIFGVGLTKSKIAAIVFDCIFGAGCIYVIWKTNLELNNGECRLFLFVGLLFGAIITYVTCKRTLDKLSAMLYNLFTTKFANVVDNGKTILQKVNSSDSDSGDTDTGIAGLHATGNADANGRTKRSRRRAGSQNRRSKGRRKQKGSASRRNERQRVADKMGGRARTHQ